MNRSAFIGLTIVVLFLLANGGVLALQYFSVGSLESKLRGLEDQRGSLMKENTLLARQKNNLNEENQAEELKKFQKLKHDLLQVEFLFFQL